MRRNGDPHGLNPRQRKFVELYLAGTPVTRAYLAAGYAARPEVAATCACRLLRQERVAAAVETGREELRQAARMTKEDAVEWLCEAVRTPVGEIDETHRLAQEVVTTESRGVVTTRKVKMVGKMDAMKQLAAMLGWNGREKAEAPREDKLAALLRRLRGGD